MPVRDATIGAILGRAGVFPRGPRSWQDEVRRADEGPPRSRRAHRDASMESRRVEKAREGEKTVRERHPSDMTPRAGRQICSLHRVPGARRVPWMHVSRPLFRLSMRLWSFGMACRCKACVRGQVARRRRDATRGRRRGRRGRNLCPLRSRVPVHASLRMTDEQWCMWRDHGAQCRTSGTRVARCGGREGGPIWFA